MQQFKSVFIVLCILLSLINRQVAAQQTHVSYQEIDWLNPKTQEPLKLSIWFPSSGVCVDAHLCVAENVKLEQGIVLTHGAMGSAKEMNWIGYATASQGFVTVGINHYGESWIYGKHSVKPERASMLWNRAEEVSVALDLLTANLSPKSTSKPLFDKPINWHNVTAIGFSSGGSTVISLAGGLYDPAIALNYCNSLKSKGDLGCKYVQQTSGKTISVQNAAKSYKDERVKRIIALDPAAGQMTLASSLQNIAIPVLIIGAKHNDFLPFEHHAAYYHQNIHQASLVTLENKEGHFVFLDKCEHQYKAMGVALCKDRDGVDRDAVHKRLYKDIFAFLYRS